MGCGRWSDWYFIGALFDDGMPVPKEPGVYAIRYAPGGKPKTIGRVFRPDPKGILCYGRDGDDLRGRLRDFYRAAQGNGAPQHIEGERFHKLNYPRNGYLLKNVQVQWRNCTSKEDAKRVEAKLLNKYARCYGEAPPLNRQVPKDC